MRDDEAMVKDAYVTLLRIPIGEVRMLCQPALGALCATLATLSGEDREETKKFYEKLAMDISNL